MGTPIPLDTEAGQGQQHLFPDFSPVEPDSVTATVTDARAPEVGTESSADQEQSRYISLYSAELAILDGKARALHLWCVLLEYADWQTDTCYPGRDTLAKRLGVTVDTVDAQIKVLAGLGLVTKSHRKTADGDSDTNLYTLHRQRGVAESIRPPSRTHSATGSRAHSARVAEPIRPELIPEELIPEERRERAANAAPPALLAYLNVWNENCPPGRKVKIPPSKTLRSGWARVCKDPELREAFSDLPRLGAAIRNASWAREEPWFRAEALFTRDSNRLAWKAQKLLAGDYGHRPKRQGPSGHGYQHGAGEITGF